MREALELVAEVTRDFSETPLFLGSDLADTIEEAQHNQHAFSLTAEQARQLPAERLTQMLRQVVAAKREQLHALRGSTYPMQFYCWHDEQAGQVRFSLISSAAPLPFGCQVRLVADLSSIVSAFLSASSDDEIPWHEVAAADEMADDSSAYYLDVWKTQL
ncbi:hypothetical protein E5K00_02475 [Hymenobacter aquaticus]|uniref:Uncharacterized protein n=1 Tax=Hymenobacter aquaticus TaxID=1867101 RepID=A0A4Z0Q3N4_9BACT|nr:hypothetical protein [Hymenobacter aquaticus]TGE24099.1 hypothetical protein E5K00_02475 [Hymenobacter aquaticus]